MNFNLITKLFQMISLGKACFTDTAGFKRLADLKKGMLQCHLDYQHLAFQCLVMNYHHAAQ